MTDSEAARQRWASLCDEANAWDNLSTEAGRELLAAADSTIAGTGGKS